MIAGVVPLMEGGVGTGNLPERRLDLKFSVRLGGSQIGSAVMEYTAMKTQSATKRINCSIYTIVNLEST